MKDQTTTDEQLGLDQQITRRDFLNASLIGAGGALLAAPSPLELLAGQKAKTQKALDDWYGYGGVGDYAASHGNTPEVVRVSHDIRDGKYDQASAGVIDMKESFDVVIVGGGFSGLGAAYYLKRTGRANQKCLLLDQHPIFGGIAKANEFIVNGQRLLGPQGSNDFMQPAPASLPPEKWRDNARATAASIYAELKMPTHYEFQKWDDRSLQFGLDNFGPMYWTDHEVSVGYFFEQKMVKTCGGTICATRHCRSTSAGICCAGARRLILNRWGHAYVCPAPGFHFGRDGQPAPRDVVRQRHGRIAFGHAEFEGHQNYSAALINGIRAMHQVMEVL